MNKNLHITNIYNNDILQLPVYQNLFMTFANKNLLGT